MRILIACFASLLLFAGAASAQKTAPATQPSATQPSAKRPNIVWITSEDHGPHLGCYGDKLARTPNVDKLAAKGMTYRRCWSNAPVCAPARTTIITGLYPTSTGSENMRSQTVLPKNRPTLAALLRLLGYYCTNRVKEDYNLVGLGKIWDESSKTAHWKNRQPGQPFFAVFNSVKSHESQVRGHKKPPVTDVAKVRVPAYHPDVAAVRTDWGHYYDVVALADADAGAVLKELEDAGLLEDTIVFYFADHGPGLPRLKRTPLDSGLHVPLVVYFPEKYRHLAPKDYRPGGRSERLTSFVDLAPTLLSLAGSEPPAWMQGRAFAGAHVAEPPRFLHGFRNRMDSTYDLQRSVTDGRYVYLRNYLPHLPAGQYVEYMWVTKTTQVWKQMLDAGKLDKNQSLFFQSPRTPEELYDLETDPDEVRNLAGSKEHAEILAKLRQANRDHVFRIRDMGFLPEDEIHVRSAGSSPYEFGQDPKKYPLDEIYAMADLASGGDPAALPRLKTGLGAADSAVRYWAALGLVMRGKDAVTPERAKFKELLKDPSPSVGVVTAEALVHFGDDADAKAGLQFLLDRADPRGNSLFVAMAALNALDRLGEKARPGLPTIQSWPTGEPSNNRSAYGVGRLVTRLQKKLGTSP